MIRRQAGFTLIEILIAVLVLGIGLLGVAGLQSATLRINQGAYLRSQATLLARDIGDRMRANPRGAADGAYDMGGSGSASLSSSCETTSGCGTTVMASHDLAEWINTVQARLPQGDAVVCIDSSAGDGTPGAPACDGSGDSYLVKIWWFETEDQEDQRFETEIRP